MDRAVESIAVAPKLPPPIRAPRCPLPTGLRWPGGGAEPIAACRVQRTSTLSPPMCPPTRPAVCAGLGGQGELQGVQGGERGRHQPGRRVLRDGVPRRGWVLALRLTVRLGLCSWGLPGLQIRAVPWSGLLVLPVVMGRRARSCAVSVWLSAPPSRPQTSLTIHPQCTLLHPPHLP